MKVGYLGPAGTFSQQAAEEYAAGLQDAVLQEYPTIFDVLSAVQSGEVDDGVVPLENSTEGAVTAAIDMLIFQPDLFIAAELVIPVRENLLVHQGYAGEPITEILSHPQALAQCGNFLREYFPTSRLVPVSSTAEAARMVAKGSGGQASLSPAQAARVYGLRPLYEQVQDDKSNATRFVIVTQKVPCPDVGGLKTSIVFSTEHRPGDLYRVLQILSLWDINMTKIESRPMKRKLGTYAFFIDLEAESLSDLEEAMQMIRRKTSYFKYIGSYPVLQQKG